MPLRLFIYALICSFLISCQQPKTILAKTLSDSTSLRIDSLSIVSDGVHKGFLANIKKPIEVRTYTVPTAQNKDVYKDIIFPALALIIPVGIFWFTIAQKRSDEKRTIRLKRLDEQISCLYGPLFTWYEIGQSNFQAYLRSGYYASFADTHYLLWLDEVFLRTNQNIEDLIIKNSSLFVGNLPKECVDFCQHISVLKACIAEVKSAIEKGRKDINLKELDNRMEQYPHPTHKLEAYIKVVFKILKDQQNKLLSGRSQTYEDGQKKYLSKKTEEKIVRFSLKKGIKENDIDDFIQSTYLDEAEFFSVRDRIRENISAIPFDASMWRHDNYKDEIKKHKIEFEKIYQMSAEFGEIDPTTNYLSQKIKYNAKGCIEKVEFHYRRNSPLSHDNINEEDSISAIAKYEYKDEKVVEKLFQSPEGTIIGKAKYQNSSSKSEIIYYSSSKQIEFIIEILFDSFKKKVCFLKYDGDRNLIRVITSTTETSTEGLKIEKFKWFNPKDYDTNLENLKLKAHYWERDVTLDKAGNIAITKDKDVKTGYTKVINYDLEYMSVANCEVGLFKAMVINQANGTPAFKRIFKLTPFGGGDLI